jgi:hypothetical protein
MAVALAATAMAQERPFALHAAGAAGLIPDVAGERYNREVTRRLLRLARLGSRGADGGDRWGDWSLDADDAYGLSLSLAVRDRAGACDLWWGYCDPGFQPGTLAELERSASRGAWSMSFGASLPRSWSNDGSWFIDLVPMHVGIRF